MGIGLAFGTGFVQKTQQLSDEARAEEAYGRLKDREITDYKYKSDIDTTAAEHLAQKKVEMAQTEEDRIRTRRRTEATDLFKGLSGKKFQNAVTDYVNDPTASAADVTTKWSGLHESTDGSWETADQNKVSTALNSFTSSVTGTPYEGSPYAEDVMTMLKQGTTLIDIKRYFRETLKDGKIHLQPKDSATGKGLQAFEVKGLREAGDMQLFDPMTLQFAKIKRTTNMDGTTSYAGMDPIANEYIASYRTAVRENYNYMFKKTGRAPGFEDAAQQAHQQMAQQYGTMSQYITNRQAGGPAIGATQQQAPGAQPIPKQAAADFVQELVGQDVATVISQHAVSPENLKVFGDTILQIAKEYPEYRDALAPVMSAVNTARTQ